MVTPPVRVAIESSTYVSVAYPVKSVVTAGLNVNCPLLYDREPPPDAAPVCTVISPTSIKF